MFSDKVLLTTQLFLRRKLRIRAFGKTFLHCMSAFTFLPSTLERGFIIYFEIVFCNPIRFYFIEKYLTAVGKVLSPLSPNMDSYTHMFVFASLYTYVISQHGWMHLQPRQIRPLSFVLIIMSASVHLSRLGARGLASLCNRAILCYISATAACPCI